MNDLLKLFKGKYKKPIESGSQLSTRIGNDKEWIAVNYRRVPVQVGQYILFRSVFHCDDGPALEMQTRDGRALRVYMKDGFLCPGPNGSAPIQGNMENDGLGAFITSFEGFLDGEPPFLLSADGDAEISHKDLTAKGLKDYKPFLRRARNNKAAHRIKSCKNCGTLNP